MAALLVSIFFLYLLYLLWEAHTARVARKKLAHVVHVNGTRGKSTVSRLIEAGLRAGGTSRLLQDDRNRPHDHQCQWP